MTIQALNNVSFDQINTTKNGNPYNKTHIATKIGLLSGMGYAGYTLYGIKKSMKDTATVKSVLRKLVPEIQRLQASGIEKATAKKIAKAGLKSGIGTVIAGTVLLGLTIGACVNKLINIHRARKADKLAEKNV